MLSGAAAPRHGGGSGPRLRARSHARPLLRSNAILRSTSPRRRVRPRLPEPGDSLPVRGSRAVRVPSHRQVVFEPAGRAAHRRVLAGARGLEAGVEQRRSRHGTPEPIVGEGALVQGRASDARLRRIPGRLPQPALFLAGCASPGGASRAEERSATPGVELVIASDRAAALRGEAAAAGIAVPATSFSPRGPNVTVHVARATRAWLAGKVLHPEAVDALLADESNFFPDCTICKGVRVAFEDYGRTLRALPPTRPRGAGSRVSIARCPLRSARLVAFQSSSERLAPLMQAGFAEHIRSVEDRAERARERHHREEREQGQGPHLLRARQRPDDPRGRSHSAHPARPRPRRRS